MSLNETEKLGIKSLTADNWLQMDSASQFFIGVSQEVWVRYVLDLRLNETVPLEVRQLFQVAQSALIYGYFFYPLFALAGDQLWRVAECAVTAKAREMGAPSRADDFQKKIDWLAENGKISFDEKERWHGIRYLRNSSSHPTSQNLYPPVVAKQSLEIVATMINALFNTH